jgi:hypothetical protein
MTAVFPPELVLDIIRTHPTVIYRGGAGRNMCYIPPDEPHESLGEKDEG